MLKVSEAIDEKVRTDNGGTVLVALCVVKQAKLQKVRQSSEQRRNGDESEEERREEDFVYFVSDVLF